MCAIKVKVIIEESIMYALDSSMMQTQNIYVMTISKTVMKVLGVVQKTAWKYLGVPRAITSPLLASQFVNHRNI